MTTLHVKHLTKEIERLRQAHWDGRAIGGFDNDGNPTPKAVVSNFSELIRRDWADMRADLDEARNELYHLRMALERIAAGCDGVTAEKIARRALQPNAHLESVKL
jgi:hypothetical protein